MEVATVFHFCLLESLGAQSSAIRTVCIIGELDQESANACLVAATGTGTGTGTGTIAVDLSQLTFMDSSGYQALVDARRRLEADGGSLTLINPAGQPMQLLALLAEIRQLDYSQDASGCIAHRQEQAARSQP